MLKYCNREMNFEKIPKRVEKKINKLVFVFLMVCCFCEYLPVSDCQIIFICNRICSNVCAMNRILFSKTNMELCFTNTRCIHTFMYLYISLFLYLFS